MKILLELKSDPIEIEDSNKDMSDDEQYFSDNSNMNDRANLEKEMEMLKDFSDSTEQELLTVATGLPTLSSQS